MVEIILPVREMCQDLLPQVPQIGFGIRRKIKYISKARQVLYLRSLRCIDRGRKQPREERVRIRANKGKWRYPGDERSRYHVGHGPATPLLLVVRVVATSTVFGIERIHAFPFKISRLLYLCMIYDGDSDNFLIKR